MVWYICYMEEFVGFYKKVGECFCSEKKCMQELLVLCEDKLVVLLLGDIVDVWYDCKFYWLIDVLLVNKVIFEIFVDSNFKVKDVFLWFVDYIFFLEGEWRVIMGFNILFDNDFVVGCVKDIMCFGVQILYIKFDFVFVIKSVSGFIYYMDSDLLMNKLGLIINNIVLICYYELVDIMIVVGKDSLVVEQCVGIDLVVIEKKVDLI